MGGAGLAGGGYALSQLINLAIYVVLARLATPDDFGELAAGSVVVMAGLFFADSGMSAAVIQRRDRLEEAASTAVVSTMVGGILLTLGALAIAPLIGWVFQSHQVTLVAAASSGWILLRALASIPDALMQRRFSFMRRVVVDPVGIVVFGAVAIATTALGMGVWGLVLGNYAQFAAMALASWVLAKWRPNLRLASFAMWRELIAFGRHVMVSGVIARVSSSVNTAIVGRLLGTATLGQLRYGTRIVQAPLGAMVNAGSYVLYPALSRISADPARFEQAFRRAIRMTCSIAMPASFLLLPLGVPLAVLLFGGEWRQAGQLTSAMFAFPVARAFLSITREAFKASGRTELLTKSQLVSAVLTIGLVVGFSSLGATGLGAAISLSSIGVAVYAANAVGPITGITGRRMIQAVWPSLAASVVMASGLYVAELLLDAESHGTATGLAILVGEGLAGVVVYFAVLALIAPESARELVGVVRHFRQRLGRRRMPKPAIEPESSVATPMP
jgi:O-antigen/teichoic acid export membrane protein